ncbi:MAG: hypothetical protein IT306_30965 [Chloroflexi bacterium]|nr:hypothetical protein [Chloroflexota bacterium]
MTLLSGNSWRPGLAERRGTANEPRGGVPSGCSNSTKRPGGSQGLATSHDHGPAGNALPAIPVGLVARVGSVGTQRLGLPLAFVRADVQDPSTAAHEWALLRAAVRVMGPEDALVLDAGFEIRQRQDAEATRCYVARAAKNVTGCGSWGAIRSIIVPHDL